MKKTALFLPLSILSASVLLVGCGGGGGSSVKSAGAAPATLITSNPASFDAVTNEVDYTALGPVATSAVDRGISQTSRTDLTYNSSGDLTKLVVTTPGSTVTWDSTSGDTQTPVPGFSDHIVLSDAANSYDMLVVDTDFDYQAFGVWRTGNGTAAGVIGGLSFGLKTASVPVTGNATFTGQLVGTYINAIGQGNFVKGAVSINSDFAARSLAFSTSGTSTINPSSGATSAISSLDMTGTLTYGAGANAFSGGVSTAGTGLTGTASGAFYGPNAAEIGGVFNVKAASGVEFYSGSFGAKQ
ncbi:transferrin-binding protein-like solute binding protein [Neptunomonas japonica]|uniref:Transferrin-binding protein B C-lobe/N-lobe beta-barrel domain-containing protein n=1 Tax=Neptunomonas japonica JAMM 1380 TaxID=1441457 RepID=A0A7R6SVN3_9GAMM|nr:transferrin-binding protein-like solute binding protein [Neptunomonas japonica]BBB28905.1 conserved hypothetical protein [Neptunomonas japonica JAMM 1380]